MVFTPAAKSSKMCKFVTLQACTFLKRHFKYRKDLEYWVAPLDMDSIMRSMMWVMPSRHVTPEFQMRACFDSVCWELAIHLDEHKYKEITIRLMEAISVAYCSGERFLIPEYAFIVNTIRRIPVEQLVPVVEDALPIEITCESGNMELKNMQDLNPEDYKDFEPQSLSSDLVERRELG